MARIHAEYANRGVNVVAVNIDPRYPLEQWTDFWKSTGAGDVLWAQDTNSTTVTDYRLVTLGTEVIVDGDGLVVFRSDGPSGYERLRSAVEQAL